MFEISTFNQYSDFFRFIGFTKFLSNCIQVKNFMLNKSFLKTHLRIRAWDPLESADYGFRTAGILAKLLLNNYEILL